MKFFKAVRRPGYVGPIRESKAECLGELTDDPKIVLKKLYEEWAETFFESKPNGRLQPTFSDDSVVVRGTGDNGRWLIAWWVN